MIRYKMLYNDNNVRQLERVKKKKFSFVDL